ncbi:sensory neuron membrane protein 1 [Malaya genurostris]|uniref:sensory neuron membrane protein 1 n=1 Tax=Malaya genurostris TaxID=325434 RepID=UPI0026F3CEB4|nr:sensory neuron membrane protein 1 [Malaya genurostris]XP_058451195.1 sensory neuron membrane protein 1 [Malaya genurostris]
MKVEELNFKKIAIICAITLVGGLTFSYGIFPSILKFMLKQNVLLKPGTQMRGMYEHIPFPLNFKIHLFNVTNPDEIMRGGKPRVKDVGPFFFEEWKDRFDLEDDPTEDTLTYTLRNTFIFRPDLSAPYTGEEILVLPDILLLSALLMVQRDREAMMPLVSKATNIVFDPMTGFRPYRVMDFLFDGIPVNCASQDFAAKALCSGMESEGALKEHNETHYLFSMFGMRNGTDAGRWVVYRGVKNIRDLGRVVSYNDETEMDVYDGDSCNQYIGTDSTIFPPFLTKDDKLWAWSPDICRSLGANYVGKAKYAGLPMSLFKLDFGDLKNEPENHCFCRDPPDDCPPKGTMDLSPCLGGPLIGSKPHFIDADPQLLRDVDGLEPDEEKHNVRIYFELRSGTPVSGVKRLQFSLELEPIKNHEVFGQLPKVILPLMWVEEGISLNKTWTNQLKYQLFLGLKFNATVKWLTIIIGTIGSIGAGYMHFKGTSKTMQVTPVESKSDSATGERNPSANPNNKDMVSINNSRNLPAVIDWPEKPPKVVAAELQTEKY